MWVVYLVNAAGDMWIPFGASFDRQSDANNHAAHCEILCRDEFRDGSSVYGVFFI